MPEYIKRKRGQEEIVGFVLIMVIMAIVFLIFLGISIRRNTEGVGSESAEIYQFLESSMEFTTSCLYSSAPDYLTLGELFEYCYNGNKCLDGKSSCEILNNTLKGILKGSWNVEDESNVKGYELLAVYDLSSSSQAKEIISLKEGSCAGFVKGASYINPAFPGKIEISLEICY